MTPSPGWYADPARRHQFRYWDGRLWTEHVAGPQGTGVDPLPQAPQQQEQQGYQGHGGQGQQQGFQGQPGYGGQGHPGQSNAAAAPTAPAQPAAQGGSATSDPFREPSLSLLRFDHGETVQLQYATPSGHVVVDSIEEAKPEQDIENDSIDELTRKQRTTTMQVGDPATGRLIARVAHYKPIKSSFTVTGPAGELLFTGKQANVFGAARFEFVDAQDGPVGTIRADGARAKHFDVEAPNGTVLARLDKHGSYDIQLNQQEANRTRPVTSAGQWLGQKAVEAVTDQTRDQLRFVLNRPQPVGHPPLAQLTLLSAILMELSFSVL
ncbi:DUF2510 domain-containing protein [Ruania zhangjianzhongii]|uniref:DUF2510 domain-containing protein n=1 Tax=Ruania zhangjianzhongii TaxID=2603206 RepID=UPI0011CCCEDD|nr:DUF2510 domain-containing protein [Ruania zhangjianzhongii]